MFLTMKPVVSTLATNGQVVVGVDRTTPRFTRIFTSLVTRCFSSSVIYIILNRMSVTRTFDGVPFSRLLCANSATINGGVVTTTTPGLAPIALRLNNGSPIVILRNTGLRTTIGHIVVNGALGTKRAYVTPSCMLVRHGSRLEDSIVADGVSGATTAARTAITSA